MQAGTSMGLNLQDGREVIRDHLSGIIWEIVLVVLVLGDPLLVFWPPHVQHQDGLQSWV